MRKTLSIFLGLLILFSCSNKDGTSSLIIRLTDSPGDYQKVIIDLQSVEVNSNTSSGNGVWQTLNTNSGPYDLLKLTNGVETIIANDTYPSGVISQIRLVLGDNNLVVVDGVEYALKVPGGSQSGLKLQINKELIEGITYSIVLDFDAAKSVVKSGASGKYILKPVIKTITEAQDGAIRGTVQPSSLNVAIYVIYGSDTLGTSYASKGDPNFFVGGLPGGNFKVSIDPGDLSGYQAAIIDNVSVSLGKVTTIDPVELIR